MTVQSAYMEQKVHRNLHPKAVEFRARAQQDSAAAFRHGQRFEVPPDQTRLTRFAIAETQDEVFAAERCPRKLSAQTMARSMVAFRCFLTAENRSAAVNVSADMLHLEVPGPNLHRSEGEMATLARPGGQVNAARICF